MLRRMLESLGTGPVGCAARAQPQLTPMHLQHRRCLRASHLNVARSGREEFLMALFIKFEAAAPGLMGRGRGWVGRQALEQRACGLLCWPIPRGSVAGEGGRSTHSCSPQPARRRRASSSGGIAAMRPGSSWHLGQHSALIPHKPPLSPPTHNAKVFGRAGIALSNNNVRTVAAIHAGVNTLSWVAGGPEGGLRLQWQRIAKSGRVTDQGDGETNKQPHTQTNKVRPDRGEVP